MSFLGHSSSLCLCFIGIDSKTFIVLDNLPCGLQYFLASVIQTGFPSRWSKCCCQTLLPQMCFVHTSSWENVFIGFTIPKIILFFRGSTQLYCCLSFISALVMQLCYLLFFHVLLRRIWVFSPLMWNTFPCYSCNTTFLHFFQIAIQNLPFVSTFSHPKECWACQLNWMFGILSYLSIFLAMFSVLQVHKDRRYFCKLVWPSAMRHSKMRHLVRINLVWYLNLQSQTSEMVIIALFIL